jgi:DNA-binding MarR family transcriptional regulator
MFVRMEGVSKPATAPRPRSAGRSGQAGTQTRALRAFDTDGADGDDAVEADGRNADGRHPHSRNADGRDGRPARHDNGARASIDAIEGALVAIARRINLPRVHERVMVRAGVTGIDRASYVTLSRIADHGPLRLSELAALLGVDLSAVSRQVASIERHGLVDRTADPSDRRAAVVELSDDGRRVLEQLRAAARARLTELLADWTDDERVELARALTRFNDAVERFGDRP